VRIGFYKLPLHNFLCKTFIDLDWSQSVSKGEEKYRRLQDFSISEHLPPSIHSFSFINSSSQGCHSSWPESANGIHVSRQIKKAFYLS